VVPSERDHARVMLPVLRDRYKRRPRQRIVRQGRERRAVQQIPMSRLDLLDRERVVVRRDGYIAAVNDLEPGQERVHPQWDVVPAVQRQAARSRADTCRSEACSRSVRRAGVLRRISHLSDCAHVVRERSYKLTKGAPRNAISNGTSLSFVRHCTHGSFAKVVIPEKIASAVTESSPGYIA